MTELKVNNWSDYRDGNGKLSFVWPYTNRCPDCDEEAMVGTTCTNCGKENYQVQCAECGTWQNNRHFTEGKIGCVKCKNITGSGVSLNG